MAANLVFKNRAHHNCFYRKVAGVEHLLGMYTGELNQGISAANPVEIPVKQVPESRAKMLYFL